MDNMSLRPALGGLALALALVMTACGSGSADESSAADPPSSTTDSVAIDVDETTTEAPATTAPPTTAPTSVASTTDAPVATSASATTQPVGPLASLEPVCADIGKVDVGSHSGTITSNGVEYVYQWTVPSSYNGDPIAVVLDFHGIGSNGAQQAVFSGWSAKAEAEGFLSVEPTGVTDPTDGRASWELPFFDTDARDDVAFVLDLLDHVAANVCIDPARVYSTGMSNGGLFTSEVVCDLSERIAAAVSVAGVSHHESCVPSRAVPYLAFHGTDDVVVPFAGGGTSALAGSEGSSEFFEQVMPDEFAEFAADFGCTDSADVAVTAEVSLRSWTGCDDEVEVGFYTITGAGHTWPGSRVSENIPSLGVTNMDIDATGIAWEFFSRHSLLRE